MSQFSFVTRLICQQFVDGQWREIPSSQLTNPLETADWVRLHPLRLNVIADGHNKAGVAENPRDLRRILDAIATRSKPDYKVEKRQNEEFIPHNGRR